MHSTLYIARLSSSFFFFFNDTATTEIYTLSLHDALPICWQDSAVDHGTQCRLANAEAAGGIGRSEEHTSELQSHLNLVCRLLLEKKKKKKKKTREICREEREDSVLKR